MADKKKTAPEDKKTTAKAKAPAKTADKAEAKAAAADKPAKKQAKTGRKRAPLAPRTYFAKPGDVAEKWRLIDAAGQPLGRLSTHIATILMGKDKPRYTAHIDTGDFVIVVNASQVALTGKKWEGKTYHYHTNYPGGIKSFTARELLEKYPQRLIEWSVYGMLPKSKGHMARKWFKKLRVFSGADHPHAAQKPEKVNLPSLTTREAN